MLYLAQGSGEATQQAGSFLAGGLVFIIFLIVIYFVPVIIAMFRNHKNASSITLLVIFAGWTFIGWGIALLWSLHDEE